MGCNGYEDAESLINTGFISCQSIKDTDCFDTLIVTIPCEFPVPIIRLYPLKIYFAEHSLLGNSYYLLVANMCFLNLITFCYDFVYTLYSQFIATIGNEKKKLV